MTISDREHLIASRFSIALFFIFKAQCLIFLLLRSPPLSFNLHQKEVTITCIAGSHFVSATFHPNIKLTFLLIVLYYKYISILINFLFIWLSWLPLHPIASIALNWRHNVTLWPMEGTHPYADRIEQFKQIVLSSIATLEIIEL